MAETMIAVGMRSECDRDHYRRKKGGASDMWLNEGRMDAMETRITKLEEQIHLFPQQVESAVLRAMDAHEKREKEWISDISAQITEKIFEGLLGEDLATGPEAAKNRRAMQQMLRQGVSMAPFMVKIQTRAFILLSMLLVGVLFVLFVGSGTVIEFLRIKMKMWLGS